LKNRSVPGTPNLLRLVNRNTILMLLEQMELTSRTELSNLTGLSVPTVSAVVKDLLEEGWVEEVPGGISHGGKPPQLIKLNPDARLIGAVQMNEDKARIWITNLAGRIYAVDELTIGKDSAKSLCTKTANRLKQLIETNSLKDKPFLGVGVAVPGVVSDKGTVSNAPEFGWDDEPIQQYFSDVLNFDVIVENDVRLAVMGESWRRKGIRETIVYVHLSKGIGAGILIDGMLYRGFHFAAGEIGHMIVNPSDIKEPVNNKSFNERQGYFESQYGLKNLESADEEKKERILKHIAYGVVNIISLLDPEIIVFGGEMTTKIENFLEKLTKFIKSIINIYPEMYITPLGNDASLFGATKIVLENQKSLVTWTNM